MKVTRIEDLSKNKFRVFIDGQFAFWLYRRELTRYHIKEGVEIQEDIYRQIKRDIVLQRAKLRVFHLLKDMDRTEEQLRIKLRMNTYTEDIIEQAISYAKNFGYVNDVAYAERYVESRKKDKSRKELFFQLLQKGITKEIVEQVLEECYEREDARSTIMKLMKKKHYSPEDATKEDEQRICAYLMRKGFCYEDIRQVIQVSEWNT